jgi:putative membrane protein
MAENASADGARVHDLGLQLERTALAWRRTALALVVAALIATKAMALRETVAFGLVSAGLLVVAAGAAWIGARRYRRGALLFVREAQASSAASSAVSSAEGAGLGGRALATSSVAVALVGVGAIGWVLLGTAG